jgi:hypothetical protein
LKCGQPDWLCVLGAASAAWQCVCDLVGLIL